MLMQRSVLAAVAVLVLAFIRFGQCVIRLNEVSSCAASAAKSFQNWPPWGPDPFRLARRVRRVSGKM
jgi:hypothetical protein